MKLKYTFAAMAATTLAANAAITNIGDSADGGIDASQVSNWSTNNTVYAGGGTIGMAFEWENVTATTSNVDLVNNKWDFVMTSTANHTIGHGYLMNESFDLSTTTAGIEDMTINLDMNASANPNWRPMLAVTVSGVTNLYGWNSSTNPWSGNSAITASTGEINARSTTWGLLKATGGSIGAIRENDTNPSLQATEGIVQFGFFQWGASTGGSANIQNGTLAVDSFNYGVTYTAVPEPSSTALLGLGGLALILRRRK